jgi:hypothetical protein
MLSAHVSGLHRFDPKPHQRFSNEKRGSGRRYRPAIIQPISKDASPQGELADCDEVARDLGNHRGRHHPATTGRVLEHIM